MLWSQDEYIRAYHFAARAHRWQLYPGTSIPYIMHLSFVSMEIFAAQGGFEPPLRAPTPRGVGAGSPSPQEQLPFNMDLALQCALLHDVLEDTHVRYEQVRDEFGEAVADGVRALTIDKRLPKSEQMAECLPRIRQQPREIWMVKLADRITNLQPPPRHWSKARIRDYHLEAQLILASLSEASPFLAERLRAKISAYAAFVA